MNTETKPINFRSDCCDAPMLTPKIRSVTMWHELSEGGESTLKAYGACSKCLKMAEFTEVK